MLTVSSHRDWPSLWSCVETSPSSWTCPQTAFKRLRDSVIPRLVTSAHPDSKTSPSSMKGPKLSKNIENTWNADTQGFHLLDGYWSERVCMCKTGDESWLQCSPPTHPSSTSRPPEDLCVSILIELHSTISLQKRAHLVPVRRHMVCECVCSKEGAKWCVLLALITSAAQSL